MITKFANIADGVKLNYIETDKFKTNYISFNFMAPLDKERSCFNALLCPVLMRGTEKYPTQSSINKRLQYLYSGEIAARNDKAGEYQVFGLKANMLDNRYTRGTNVTDGITDILCGLIFRPHLENGIFAQSYVEGEKINLIDAIDAEINNKTKYSMLRLNEEMFRSEVFGISKYGTKEQVEKITSAELYGAYRYALERYKIEIYFVGQCDFEKVKEKFASYFKGIKRDVIPLQDANVVLSSSGVKEVVDIEAVNQGKLCLGFRTGCTPKEDNYYLLQLFSEVYGGSPTSKLFMNVREKMSLCYYCRSVISQRSGSMTVASGIEVKNKKIAEDEIIAQLDAIKRCEITDEELESAKKSLKNGYMQIYDSAESMETWSMFRSIGESKCLSPVEECKKVDSATASDIANIASKMTLDTVYFLKGEEKNG
ncbi:MAG: EF-P 5-aminopentanol modification-associated protein YfmF [Eubacteriales bacterium]